MILWAHVSCPTKQKLPSLSCSRIRLQPCSLRRFPFPILNTNTGDISKLNSTIISSFFFFFFLGSYLTMPGRTWMKYRKKYNKDWECWTVGYWWTGFDLKWEMIQRHLHAKLVKAETTLQTLFFFSFFFNWADIKHTQKKCVDNPNPWWLIVMMILII